MKTVLVVNETRPLRQPVKAGYCQSFLCQLRGFTCRRQVGCEEALLLVQHHDSRLDSSIHMMFVWTDLAVVWINASMEVVDIRLARQWRPAYIPSRPASFVLEMAPQRLNEFKVGDSLRLVETAAA
jgi:uncharacterized membrane protein (UPF0127 family)